ncbi:SAM-dependent methyltransferase [Myxococcota bacterium]|nr:SAM-dependent methyltransferase [Myxococcota bacterium]
MRNEPSRTAEAVALFRASDQRRPPDARIIDDPYAKLFLGPVMRAALATLEATGAVGRFAEEHAPGLVTYVLARHRFIDDALLRALRAPSPAVEQVVLLGAGYDTRAHRFAADLSGRTVFEVDFPSTSRRKSEVVAAKASALPQADVRRVEIDFLHERLEDCLDRAGFRRGVRTFFVWEGVSMYLTRRTVQDTLATLRALGGVGSELAMDFWFLLDTPDLLSTAHRMSANFLHLLGEPLIFSIHPEDAGPFFERAGLAIEDLADARALEHRYVHDDRRVYPACYVVLAQIHPDPAR